MNTCRARSTSRRTVCVISRPAFCRTRMLRSSFTVRNPPDTPRKGPPVNWRRWGTQTSKTTPAESPIGLRPVCLPRAITNMTKGGNEIMEATRVTTEEVKERMERGEQFTFVDTRNPQAWGEAETKLPGAIRVPADEVEQHLDEIPRDRAVITYCT